MAICKSMRALMSRESMAVKSLSAKMTVEDTHASMDNRF